MVIRPADREEHGAQASDEVVSVPMKKITGLERLRARDADRMGGISGTDQQTPDKSEPKKGFDWEGRGNKLQAEKQKADRANALAARRSNIKSKLFLVLSLAVSSAIAGIAGYYARGPTEAMQLHVEQQKRVQDKRLQTLHPIISHFQPSTFLDPEKLHTFVEHVFAHPNPTRALICMEDADVHDVKALQEDLAKIGISLKYVLDIDSDATIPIEDADAGITYESIPVASDRFRYQERKFIPATSPRGTRPHEDLLASYDSTEGGKFPLTVARTRSGRWGERSGPLLHDIAHPDEETTQRYSFVFIGKGEPKYPQPDRLQMANGIVKSQPKIAIERRTMPEEGIRLKVLHALERMPSMAAKIPAPLAPEYREPAKVVAAPVNALDQEEIEERREP